MEHLKELRQSKNLTQLEVAQHLGVDRSTYVKYERGQSDPPTSTLISLAEYFGVTVDCILGIVPPQNIQSEGFEENTNLSALPVSDSEKRIIESLPYLSEDDLNAVYGLIAHLAAKNKKEDAK